jgi:hypothetical protein
MRQEKIEAGSCDASPNENCVSTAQTYSKNASKNPPAKRLPPMPDGRSETTVNDWRMLLVEQGYFERADVVRGDLGPIHVLNSPRVVVASRGGSTWVWVDNQPWGWSDATKEFLRVPSKAALRYAVELATRLRDEAQREFDRRERLKSARLAELAERMNGGAR